MTDLVHIQEIADRLNISAIGKKVTKRIETRPPYLFGFSGKPGSGKDTVAPLIASRLGVTASRLALGDLIRDEHSSALSIMRLAKSPTAATELLRAKLNFDIPTASRLVEIYSESHALAIADPYVRSNETRAALQLIANYRRASDLSYWADPWQKKALTLISEGKHVVATDFRTPVEVRAARELGFRVIRLDISRATQIKRLTYRDGVVPLDSALDDLAENQLDDFADFDLRINNEVPQIVTLNTITAYLQSFSLSALI